MASLLKKLRCEMAEVTIEFDEKIFKKKAFIADVGPNTDQDKEFAYSYGARDKKIGEHAHIFIGFGGKRSFLKLTYHPGNNPVADVREPYLEQLCDWLAGFFKKKPLEARITFAFDYDSAYESVIPLSYPLLVNARMLGGAYVVGHEIDFPSESFIDKAMISQRKTSIVVILYAYTLIDFAQFDIHKVVQLADAFASAFVTKK